MPDEIVRHESAEPEPARPQPTTADYQSAGAPGTVIAGRYTLVEKLGEGGMGEVWLARQSEPVKRTVALKLIKPGMDSRAVLARFEQERQALALMDHPNIARVLDGGLAPDRRPFFAMELVQGQPLTRFCDEAKLSIRQRLELFVPVCQAVQHAHQKGVIHRDLKPSNILVSVVDGKPVPKVIDFGVAKATAGRLTDESLSTQFGAVVGTLEYMAPEQAGLTAEDVDTRADVYSLGVVLYELLTGLRPLDGKRFKQAALAEMARVLKEEEPSKPSTRLSSDASAPSLAALRQMEPRRLTALLRGELDWVVMKCLEKQRDRRYETANGLARDLQRYLANEVVEARPPSASYRLRKFVSRHRGQVAAALVVLAVLLAGIAGTTLGLWRAERANAELAQERAKVQARFELAQRAIGTFHTGVSEDALLKNAQFKELRTRLLKEAAGFYGDLEKLLQGQTDAESRKALAVSYYQLGELTAKIGSYSEALAIHRKGLAVRRELALADGADAESRLNVVRSLNRIAALLDATGDAAAALAAATEGRGLAEALDADAPQDAVRSVLAACHDGIGNALARTGKPAEALAACRQALQLRQQVADARPDVPDLQSDLAGSHYQVGRMLARMGQWDEALAEHRQASAIFQRLVDAQSAGTHLLDKLAVSHYAVGYDLVHLSRPAEALAAYGQAQAMRQKLVDAQPAVTLFQSDLAGIHINIADLHSRTGRPAEALKAYRRALVLQQQLTDANPTVTEYRTGLAIAHFNLANLLRSMGQPGEALVEYRQALANFRMLADAQPANTQYHLFLASGHNNLASLLAQTGKPAEALDAYRESLAIRQKLADAHPANPDYQRDLASSHNNLGRLYAQERRFPEAFAALDAGLAIRRKLVEAHPRVTLYTTHLGFSHAYRGWARLRAGQRADAAVDLRRAVELWANEPAPMIELRFERARALAQLAGLRAVAQSGVSADEAARCAEQAVAALGDAIGAGWAQPEELAAPDFESVRTRADFQKLAAKLKTKGDVGGRSK